MKASDQPEGQDCYKSCSSTESIYRTVTPSGVTIATEYEPKFVRASTLAEDGATDDDVRDAIRRREKRIEADALLEEFEKNVRKSVCRFEAGP